MSDKQLNQAFSKEELGFLENVANPAIEPTEEEKKLVDTDGRYSDHSDYQHKDGTRVLTRCVSECEGPINYDYHDYDDDINGDVCGDCDYDYIENGDKIRTVALIKGENYVRFVFVHSLHMEVDSDGDDYCCHSVNLNISIGKVGEDNSSVSLDFTDKNFSSENVDYWEHDNGSMIDAEIHNILGKENPALRDVFRQYIPEGVDIANTLTKHRKNLNTMKEATQEQVNQAVFMKALDKWKNTK